MKKQILTFLSALCISVVFGQQNNISSLLSEKFEFKMISSGKNFPDFNTNADSLKKIVILLHYNISNEEIKNYFGWNEESFQLKVNKLIAANFVKRDINGILRPTVFVCSIKDGEKIKEQITTLTNITTSAIKAALPKIKAATHKIEALKKIDFDDISLLILSDVLLDNWQINNVENEFLAAKRTQRHGKFYYASYQEKLKNSSGEAFGIYGNQIEDTLNFSMCRYGNSRYTAEVISKNRYLKALFSHDRKNFNYPVIDTATYKELQILADDFKPTLLTILNKNKSSLVRMYNESSYAKEVSFEEYFIWLYHIYYTAVTDNLIAEKIIKVPEEKVAFYVLTNE